MNADDVQAEGAAQFLIDLAEHLVRFDYFDAVVESAEHGLAQPMHRPGAHAGLQTSPDIDAQAVWLTVIQCRLKSFS
jgi:hypothetical protein